MLQHYSSRCSLLFFFLFSFLVAQYNSVTFVAFVNTIDFRAEAFFTITSSSVKRFSVLQCLKRVGKEEREIGERNENSSKRNASSRCTFKE